jgi:hypothetical protein
VHEEELLSPVKKGAISFIKKVAGETYQGHLIRKGYDYSITLIYSIQYAFWTASVRSFTLMAQAIANPIPSIKFSK